MEVWLYTFKRKKCHCRRCLKTRSLLVSKASKYGSKHRGLLSVSFLFSALYPACLHILIYTSYHVFISLECSIPRYIFPYLAFASTCIFSITVSVATQCSSRSRFPLLLSAKLMLKHLHHVRLLHLPTKDPYSRFLSVSPLWHPGSAFEFQRSAFASL